MILGIDPGKSGGFSLRSLDRKMTAAFSFVKTTEADVIEIVKGYVPHIRHAYVEQVHSMPGQGVKSMFSFGQNYGFWLGTLYALKIPFTHVTPLKWQHLMQCKTKGDKSVSKRRAQQLFPHMKITHAIADAILIAEYGRRVFLDEEEL